MQNRKLGNSDLVVSALGLCCMGLRTGKTIGVGISTVVITLRVMKFITAERDEYSY